MKIINYKNKNRLTKIKLKLSFFRFFYIGFINTILTNTLLLLIINLLPIWISTFICQFFNLLFGFFAYSYFVFQVEKILINHVYKYIILALISWNINFILITFITNLFNVNKRIAALFTIPLLALFSFLFQKKYVFSDKNN